MVLMRLPSKLNGHIRSETILRLPTLLERGGGDLGESNRANFDGSGALHDVHGCIADGACPQVLQQVSRLESAKLHVCHRCIPQGPGTHRWGEVDGVGWGDPLWCSLHLRGALPSRGRRGGCRAYRRASQSAACMSLTAAAWHVYRSGPTPSRRQHRALKSNYFNLSARAYPQRLDNYFG